MIDRRWWWGTWALCTLVWCLVVIPRTGPLESPPQGRPFAFADFRDTVWLPIRDLLSGGVPYDVQNYLERYPWAQEFLLYVPHYFLLAWPLALLPFDVAATIWMAFLIGCVVMLVAVGVRSAAAVWAGGVAWLERAPWLVPLGTLALTFTPVVNQPLRSGQWAIPCALGAVLALTSPSMRWQVAGVMLAMVKPPVALPLLVLLVARKAWRPALAGVALTGLAALPIGVIVLVRLGGLGKGLDVFANNFSYGYTSPVGGTSGDRVASTRVDITGSLWRAGVDITPTLTAVLAGTLLVVAVAAAVVALHRFGAMHPATLVANGVAIACAVPNELYATMVLVPAVVAASLGVLGLLLPSADRAPAAEHAPGADIESTESAESAGGRLSPTWSLALLIPTLVPFVNVHRIHVDLGIPQAVSGVSNVVFLCVALAVCVAWLVRAPRSAVPA